MNAFPTSLLILPRLCSGRGQVTVGSLIAALLLPLVISAAEVMPPAPKEYFNDYAHAVSPATAARLNEKLKAFKDETSNQLVVAIFPKMESDSSIEDYTVRVAQSWRAGQTGKDNGVVLFVFMAERAMYIQVGYGLEGALPDALAKRIIEREITPRFKQRDFDGGLSAGVDAILAATKGEYKGAGSTNGTGRSGGAGLIIFFLVFGFVGFVILTSFARALGGRRRSPWGGWTIGSGGWSDSGHGWGGGWGGGGGGGGGFSGGGGSFGGGGAGGRW